MKFLADENVKSRLAKYLERRGYDITTAPKGVKNSKLFAMAKQGGRVLVSNDKDFLNSALYPVEGTPGRIILRIFPPIFENQKIALTGFLTKMAEEGCAGKLIELWKEGFEVRTK